MTVKLGEMLIQAGLINTEQLDECLKCQVIFGGRLGTNLIEMGYLEEKDLAKFLSKKLGAPCATPEQLMSVPKEVISAIPVELVQKYKVVPLALEKKRVTLAMVDPTDIAAIDEISFITGLIIMPVVAPELRLVLALEKYYDIPRETRYINMSGERRGRKEPDGKQGALKGDFAGKMKESLVPKHVTEEPDLIELPTLSDDAAFSAVGEEPVPVSPPAPVHQEEELDSLDALDDEDSLFMKLAEARDRDEIAEALISYFSIDFERGAIFMIKGKTATGWMAVVNGERLSSFNQLHIPLDSPSALKVVVEGKSFYLGPLPDTPCNSILISGLGGKKQPVSLLIPLLLMGKVVAVLMVDGGQQDLAARLSDMKRIVVKASLAFEILILKNKILSA